jgi:hypothetical protein
VVSLVSDSRVSGTRRPKRAAGANTVVIVCSKESGKVRGLRTRIRSARSLRHSGASAALSSRLAQMHRSPRRVVEWGTLPSQYVMDRKDGFKIWTGPSVLAGLLV